MENGLVFYVLQVPWCYEMHSLGSFRLNVPNNRRSVFCGIFLQEFCSHLVDHCVRHQGNEVSRLPSTMAENADKHK